ncbi:ribosomal protein L29 [Thermodesulfobium narugense DSM 14796]|uniref:Large ribosomal subunit protein uL29 n=1 Tax=Thermodesulfobium narugense DSM 14796 TaxID=747365 RepID=M1E4H0_9BACT|nr:50S ribosomal protein L29 [Thermodesulfobium narugense]AEE14152.1 ribosomal protein L29 [Thermodesulfobium narugense DSM 14796]
MSYKESEEIKELSSMDVETLEKKLLEARRELFNFRFQQATRQLTSTSKIKDVKRRIARILTLLAEKKRGVR